MQDRFKFRVWETVEKKMHYNDFVVTATGYIAALKPLLHVDNTPYENEFVFNQREMEFDKDNVLMQCTGLKDKNGKLIYEGDIVLILEDDIPYSIEYEADRAMFTISSEIDRVCANFDNYSGYELEVIGNIYENPELLRGNND